MPAAVVAPAVAGVVGSVVKGRDDREDEPATWVGPAIEGAATVGGALLGARGANRATDAQMAATDQALAFQREQAAKQEAAYKQQWEQWNASRNALRSLWIGGMTGVPTA